MGVSNSQPTKRDIQIAIIGTLHDLLEINTRRKHWVAPCCEDFDAADQLLNLLPANDLIREVYSAYILTAKDIPTADKKSFDAAFSTAIAGALASAPKTIPAEEKSLHAFFQSMTKQKKRQVKSKNDSFLPGRFLQLAQERDNKKNLNAFNDEALQNNYTPAQAKLGKILLRNIRDILPRHDFDPAELTEPVKQEYFESLCRALKMGSKAASNAIRKYLSHFLVESKKLYDKTLPEHERRNILFMGQIAVELLTMIHTMMEEKKATIPSIDTDAIVTLLADLKARQKRTPALRRSKASDNLSDEDLFNTMPFLRHHLDTLGEQIKNSYVPAKKKPQPAADLKTPSEQASLLSPPKESSQTKKSNPRVSMLIGTILLGALLTGIIIGIGVAGAAVGLFLTGTIAPFAIVTTLLGISLVLPPTTIILANIGICVGLGAAAAVATTLVTTMVSGLIALSVSIVQAILPNSKENKLAQFKPRKEGVKGSGIPLVKTPGIYATPTDVPPIAPATAQDDLLKPTAGATTALTPMTKRV